jgi:isoquinoline 1-oxidoreductase subunit alpha
MSGRSHDARRATRVEKFRRRPKDSAARAASKQSSKADADLLIMLSPTPRPSQEAAMISFTVNGKQRQVDVPPEMPLLWVLRESLNLTGTKYGCGIAVCGACTVHVDGTAVRSCVTPASAVAGRRVTTIEGLSERGDHPVQRAWTEVDVPQCGYCQSGQIMSAAALLTRKAAPTDADIDDGMSGNICRCGTYQRIRAAIHRAAALKKGGA